MVPISLLVTLEVVKYGQAYFISNDLRLYDEEKDKRCNVQSSGINEELGQISAIFSDKTGTLTCNIMNFKKICINGKNYGVDNTNNYSNKIQSDNVDFYDDNMIELLEKTDDNILNEYINKTLLHLACCHTLLIENKDNDNSDIK